MITLLQSTVETPESRNELQRGRRVVRPHNQCEYKQGDKWNVPGQMLLLPCEEKKEQKKKQDKVHLGERGVFSQRVEVM